MYLFNFQNVLVQILEMYLFKLHYMDAQEWSFSGGGSVGELICDNPLHQIMYLFKIASCRSVTTPCIAATFFTLWLTYWPVDKILEIVECIFPNWISYLFKIALCGSYIAATFVTRHIGQDLRKNQYMVEILDFSKSCSWYLTFVSKKN